MLRGGGGRPDSARGSGAVAGVLELFEITEEIERASGSTDLLDVRRALFQSFGEAFAIVHLFLDERGFADGEFQLQGFEVGGQSRLYQTACFENSILAC